MSKKAKTEQVIIVLSHEKGLHKQLTVCTCGHDVFNILCQVYQDCIRQTVTKPYMVHNLTSSVNSLQFCPYEDVLGVGHGNGFSSLLIPGKWLIIILLYCLIIYCLTFNLQKRRHRYSQLMISQSQRSSQTINISK